MATYVIGDLQGCYDEFIALLEKIQFTPGQDQLWLAGDLVNRGPKSLEVLRFCQQLQPAPKIVLGNHDLHLLAVAYTGRPTKPSDTLGAILQAPDRETLLSWLCSQKLIHFDRQHQCLMVHAGIPPQWDLAQSLALAAEVERCLQSPNKADRDRFLRQMYGNEPSLWQPELAGTERLRLITNYLTRMRFCTSEGRLELKTKGAPEDNPEGFAPWYSFSPRHTEGTKILFGHWAALQGDAPSPGIEALDTGCVWGGTLTALCLESGQRTQVAAQL